MSSTLTPDVSFHGIDMDRACRNWWAGRSADVRMTNHAEALNMLSRGVQHLMGHCPRVLFADHKALSGGAEASSNPTQGTDNAPILRWYNNDEVTRARLRNFRSIHGIRATDPSPTSDAFFRRSDSTATEDTATESGKYQHATGGSSIYDIAHDGTLLDRGDAPDAEQEEGMGTYNGYSLLSALIQDHPAYTIQTGAGTFAPDAPEPGEIVLGDEVEAIRAALHDVRSKNLPVLAYWSARSSAGDYANGTSSNAAGYDGVFIVSTSFINIFDLTSSAWGTATPGWVCHVYRHGIGPVSKTDGKKVKVQCRVLAHTDSDDATVRFSASSNTFASNNTDISITGGGAIQWHGTSSNFIYLNSSILSNDTSADLNKIDVLAKLDTSPTGSNNLKIYGISAWMEYGI